MALIPIHELGVDEAYRLLTDHLGVEDLPTLDAIENEDWGRDLILSRLLEVPTEVLERLGITVSTSEGSLDFKPNSRDSAGVGPE